MTWSAAIRFVGNLSGPQAVYTSYSTPGKDLGIMACISTERLLAVAVADDLLLTSDELDHLEWCRDCVERWGECITESGRRIEEHHYGMVDDSLR
jgi:hypothetical protein